VDHIVNAELKMVSQPALVDHMQGVSPQAAIKNVDPAMSATSWAYLVFRNNADILAVAADSTRNAVSLGILRRSPLASAWMDLRVTQRKVVGRSFKKELSCDKLIIIKVYYAIFIE